MKIREYKGKSKGERELVKLFRSAVQTAPIGAAESCIAAVNAASIANLANIANTEKGKKCDMTRQGESKRQEKMSVYVFRLFGLMLLQLKTIPKVIYLLTVVLTVIQSVLFTKLSLADGFACSGILNSMILLIFAWHLMIIPTENMRELEKSCKYSYEQLLLARIVCLCAIGLAVMLAAALSAVQTFAAYELGIVFALTVLLPTVCGAFNALLWISYVSDSAFAMFSIYSVSAFVAGLISEIMSEAAVWLLCGLVGIFVLGIAFQMMRIVNRRVYDETYNY